jgi:glyoxylase-like metal-dependent hydrolase (beta-lactamase superfamily II)
MSLLRLFTLFLLSTLSHSALSDSYSISQIKDNLYRYSSGTHHAVFVVTDEGIALTDPISLEGARWLKQELKKRFKQPLRYVIYSHSHHDHVYGGQVFDEPGVTFIAHEWARDDLLATRANTRIPNLVFNDELTLHLGDTQIDLRYHGPNNGKGNISIHFPQHRVLHVVDWVVLGRMPYKNLPGYDIRGTINSTRDVLAMDFDLLVGGHGEMGNKDDVRDYLHLLEQLYTAVLEGMRAGKSLEALQQELRFDDYSHLAMYEEWLPLNIEGVYNDLSNQSYLLLRPELPVTD